MKPSGSLQSLLSLHGKSALITGAAAGIGRAIARRLAEAGADLILVDMNDGLLERTMLGLSDKAVRIRSCKLDLTDREARDSLWDSCLNQPPDILINNAGIYPFADSLRVEESLYRKVMDVNLDAVYWMCQSFIRQRSGIGGVIVNVSSVEALLPFKEDLAHYSASKAGVLGLTRALAREYGKAGIRVNAIIPGGINTEGTRAAARGLLRFKFGLVGDAMRFRQRLPLKRLGDPDEVARVVLFLVSDMASYVQGAAVPVDGGFLSA